jgi:dTDP-glucose 4,6-dehydratase
MDIASRIARLGDDARARERAEMLARSGDMWEALRGKRVFITGGTAFVGTWLLEAFVAANAAYGLGAHAVVLSRDPDRAAARVPELTASGAITYVAGDMGTFAEPPGEFALVVHAATEMPFDATPEQPLSVIEADLRGTRRVLDFARTHGTRRVLFTSSGAMYGRQPPNVTHIAETNRNAPDVLDPRSAYGESKRLSEFACISYAKVYGFESVVARLFAFVGPHLPLASGYAVGNFIGDALAGRPIAVGGDGTPFRSYLFAADLAVWLWTLLLRGESGQAYNVGSDDALTIADLARRVAVLVGNDRGVTFGAAPVPGAQAARYVPDIARARAIGLEPWTSLDEGIRRSFAAYRDDG